MRRCTRPGGPATASMRAFCPAASVSRVGMAGPRGGSGGDGADQDLRDVVAAEAEPTAADFEQTWAALPQHAQPTADAEAEFGQPADPGGLAADVGHLGPLARLH